jgi:hypothetical protein
MMYACKSHTIIVVMFVEVQSYYTTYLDVGYPYILIIYNNREDLVQYSQLHESPSDVSLIWGVGQSPTTIVILLTVLQMVRR